MIVNNSQHNTIQGQDSSQTTLRFCLPRILRASELSFSFEVGRSSQWNLLYVEVINDRWGQGFIKALNTNISAIPNEAVSIK